MAKTAYVGAKKEIAFSKETTIGTPVSTAAGDWQPHLNFDFKPVVEKVKDEPGLGRIEQTLDSDVVKRHSSGKVNLRLTKEFIGKVLVMIFGKAPSSSGSGPYTHEFTIQNTNNHVSYTVTVKDPIKGVLRYPYAMLKEANFDFAPDKIPTVALGMEASKEEGTSATPSYSTTDAYFLPQHISVKFADSLAGLDAAEAFDVAQLQFNAMKNVDKYFNLGNEAPQNIPNQRMGFGGSVNSLYADSFLRDWAHNKVQKAMRINITNGTESIKFEFPKVSFEEWADESDNNAYMKNSVQFFAQYDFTNGLGTAQLVNSIASY